MVLNVLGALAGAVKVRYAHTSVDSPVFRLYYRVTCLFCFVACALVAAADYVGNAIQCIEQNEDAIKPIETYCWITKTFTKNTTGYKNVPGVEVPGTYYETRMHSYYQWVATVLFLQGLLFYLPHLLWKIVEDKKVDRLLQGLNDNMFDPDGDQKVDNIVKYMKESWGLNVRYSVGYMFFEGLNLVNVGVQMCVINTFLGGYFLSYGSRVLAGQEGTSNVMRDAFPLLTKCSFKHYGPSGGTQVRDAMCVLPQNIINEKIFMVMWIWFIFLMVASCLQLLWHVAVFSSVSLRQRLVAHSTKQSLTPRQEVTIRKLHLGDYYFLRAIADNLDTLRLRRLLNGLTVAADKVVPEVAEPQLGAYSPLYPHLDLDTLPRRRHTDAPPQ